MSDATLVEEDVDAGFEAGLLAEVDVVDMKLVDVKEEIVERPVLLFPPWEPERSMERPTVPPTMIRIITTTITEIALFDAKLLTPSNRNCCLVRFDLTLI